MAADTLEEMDDSKLQAALIESASADKASDILEEMVPDEAADLLGDLPEHQAEDLLRRMEPDDAAEVKELMKYPEDSAGGLMTTESVSVPEGLTADEAIARLREPMNALRHGSDMRSADSRKALAGAGREMATLIDQNVPFISDAFDKGYVMNDSQAGPYTVPGGAGGVGGDPRRGLFPLVVRTFATRDDEPRRARPSSPFPARPRGSARRCGACG
jgi:Mg/Co/Ni transporter MgtE